MPSRRFHTKTRHGCERCKARRVRVRLSVNILTAGYCTERGSSVMHKQIGGGSVGSALGY